MLWHPVDKTRLNYPGSGTSCPSVPGTSLGDYTIQEGLATFLTMRPMAKRLLRGAAFATSQQWMALSARGGMSLP